MPNKKRFISHFYKLASNSEDTVTNRKLNEPYWFAERDSMIRK